MEMEKPSSTFETLLKSNAEDAAKFKELLMAGGDRYIKLLRDNTRSYMARWDGEYKKTLMVLEQLRTKLALLVVHPHIFDDQEDLWFPAIPAKLRDLVEQLAAYNRQIEEFERKLQEEDSILPLTMAEEVSSAISICNSTFFYEIIERRYSEECKFDRAKFMEQFEDVRKRQEIAVGNLRHRTKKLLKKKVKNQIETRRQASKKLFAHMPVIVHFFPGVSI